MRIFDPADTLSASLHSDQITVIKEALAAPNNFFIQNSPAVMNKAELMAEICYQHAKCNLKILLLARSGQDVDDVLRCIAKQRHIRILRAGSSGKRGGKVPPYTAARIVTGWLGRTASLCQQDLLAINQRQAEAETLRMELTGLTARKTRLKAECDAVAAGIQRHTKQLQELAQGEEKLQRDCQGLNRQREQLTAEQTKILCELRANHTAREIADTKLVNLLAAKQKNETIIAHNLARRAEITAKLNRLSEQAAWLEQKDNLNETVSDREIALRRLETEKERLVNCLSLLIAHKPAEPVFLSNNREPQVTAVAHFIQYFLEFAIVAQKVQCQDYVPASPFLSQDIRLLSERTVILKERHSDLNFTAEEKISELRELIRVLLETAHEYGWTTSLLKPSTQGVTATYHTIRSLREAANDLLWNPPPAILARLGFNTQWKRALFDLIVKAKAIEQLAASPGGLREQTYNEFDNMLLECCYLTQRIYEACYKHLMACGHAVEKACNQVREELAIAAAKLQKLETEARTFTEQTSLCAENGEVGLQKSLARIEDTLRQAEAGLKKAENALGEHKGLLAGSASKIEQEQNEQEVRLSSLSGELADAKKRLQDQQRTLVERKELLAVEQAKLAELTGEIKTVAHKITETSDKMTEWETGLAEAAVKTSIVEEWIKRITEVSPDERQSLIKIYSREANVVGMSLAELDASGPADYPYEWNVIVTDIVQEETVPAVLLPLCRGKKTILVG
ncbi:hypothetical protein [Sporomusa aerivorans]|uniref:hypothetical protein n=1 Tax=Sporomusa aerivorans TaxID=204936 RepID=UPI00352B45F0